MKNIIYNGNLDELYSLANENGELDTDKLLDWLLISSSLEYEDDIKTKITKVARKRKLDKLKNK